MCPTHSYPCPGQIFPGLILSDIKPAKRMKFKTVCYLLVQLMHCRKMFKAEIPFSSVTCEDDKVGRDARVSNQPSPQHSTGRCCLASFLSRLPSLPSLHCLSQVMVHVSEFKPGLTPAFLCSRSFCSDIMLHSFLATLWGISM